MTTIKRLINDDSMDDWLRSHGFDPNHVRSITIPQDVGGFVTVEVWDPPVINPDGSLRNDPLTYQTHEVFDVDD
jgi:hypothetical protein